MILASAQVTQQMKMMIDRILEEPSVIKEGSITAGWPQMSAVMCAFQVRRCPRWEKRTLIYATPKHNSIGHAGVDVDGQIFLRWKNGSKWRRKGEVMSVV